MRYQLHPALGGGEYEDGGDETIGTVGFQFDGVEGLVYLPRKVLTEVKPPLPPEPPPGSVVRALGRVFEQRADGEPGRWFDTLTNGWTRWPKVCEEGDPVLLVPDPMAEAPELPWNWCPGGVALSVRAVDHYIALIVEAVDTEAVKIGMTLDVARNMGLALLKAAAEFGPDPLPDWERELLEGQR